MINYQISSHSFNPFVRPFTNGGVNFTKDGEIISHGLSRSKPFYAYIQEKYRPKLSLNRKRLKKSNSSTKR